MGYSKYATKKENTATRDRDIQFVVAEELTRFGTDNNWTEVAVGHYEDGGKPMGTGDEKLYFISKYINKDGIERTSKSFAIPLDNIEEVVNALMKFMEE